MRGGRSTLFVGLAILMVAASSFGGIPGHARAASVPAHAPILIVGNADFTAANGVTGGAGSAANPYVIGPWLIYSNWSIGVDVRNTTAYFVLQDINVTAAYEEFDGVRLTNVSHGSALRLNVSGVMRGVVLEGGSALSVQDSHIWNAYVGSVFANSTQGLALTGNDLEAGPYNQCGFRLVHVRGATLVGNVFGHDGVYLDTDNRTDLDATTITPDNLVGGLPIRFYKRAAGLVVDGIPTGQLIVVNSTDVRIANLTVPRADAGMHFAFVDGLYLSSSVVQGARYFGLRLQNVTNAVLRDVQSSDSWEEDADVRGATNLTIASSSFDRSRAWGLLLQDVHDVHLLGVEASNSGWGVYGLRMDRFEIRNGNLSRNEDGLQLHNVGNGTVQGVALYSNGVVMYGYATGAAVTVTSSSNVSFMENNLTANGRGIWVQASTNLRVWSNRFVGNSFQAADDSASDFWNASYPGGGNYWSDYTGYDDCHGPLQDICTGGDGFGDTPYGIATSPDIPTILDRDQYPLVFVNPPNKPPVASIWASATSALTGVTLTFEGYSSSDPDGSIVAFAWDLGDGTTGADHYIRHAFMAAGNFTVTLTVTDNRHATNSTSITVSITTWERPVVALVAWTSPKGYSVPVPRDWTRHENYTSGNTTSDIELEGTYNGTPASLLVDAVADLSAQETTAYLGQFMNETVAQVRRQFPTVAVTDVQYRTLSGHAAIVFVLRLGSLVYEDVALVVSAAHREDWLILLTAAAKEEANLNGTFAEILAGFTITATPPTYNGPFGTSPAWLIYLAAGMAIAAAVAVTAWLLLRRRKGRQAGTKPEPVPPPTGPPKPP